jgi:hypothetical protein
LRGAIVDSVQMIVQKQINILDSVNRASQKIDRILIAPADC